MPWLLVPYRIKQRPGGHYFRYPAIDDYRKDLEKAGGVWEESEVLGNHALVYCKADAGALEKILQDPDFLQLPEAMEELTPRQTTELVQRLRLLGFPLAEIQEKLGGDLTSLTYKQLLSFITQRRVTPRPSGDRTTFVFDGEVISAKPVEELEKVVDAGGKR